MTSAKTPGCEDVPATVALVATALTASQRDPVTATRTLFRNLFAGHEYNPLEPRLWSMLSTLADRARTLRMATPPVGSGTAATSLGDNWFQCPKCEDVFEGERTKCEACSTPLATSAEALEIVLGDSDRMWIRSSATLHMPVSQDFRHILAVFGWLRVESGGRWFELYDEAGRIATAAALAKTLAIPPNVTPLGAFDDGRIVLAHFTKLELHVARANTIEALSYRTRLPPELVARQIADVMFPDGVVSANSESATAERTLRALATTDLLDLTLLGDDGYLHGDELLALLRTDGVSASALLGIARILMDHTTFIPGGTWQPKALSGTRRPGSPLLLLQPIVDRLRILDPAAFAALACELLGHVLCDPDVYDHDALGAHADMASELVAALVAIDLDAVSPAAREHLLTSFERACAAAGRELDWLVPLGGRLERFGLERVTDAMARYSPDDE